MNFHLPLLSHLPLQVVVVLFGGGGRACEKGEDRGRAKRNILGCCKCKKSSDVDGSG